MGKKITTFGDIKIKKRKFFHRKNLILLEVVDIGKVQVSVWFLQSKKIINILLVTKMMIIKLNYYA